MYYDLNKEITCRIEWKSEKKEIAKIVYIRIRPQCNITKAICD